MKKVIVSMLAGIVLVGSMSGAEVDRRQRNQQKRIAQGVKSGELTPKETANLERKEAHLRREIHRDKVDGGGLTAKEKAKINRQESNLSKQVYRKKHNNREMAK